MLLSFFYEVKKRKQPSFTFRFRCTKILQNLRLPGFEHFYEIEMEAKLGFAEGANRASHDFVKMFLFFLQGICFLHSKKHQHHISALAKAEIFACFKTLQNKIFFEFFIIKTEVCLPFFLRNHVSVKSFFSQHENKGFTKSDFRLS